MQFKSVKRILQPLIRGGQEWQFIDLTGKEEKPRFYFSDIQWVLIIISILSLAKLPCGLSQDMIGYIMSGFSISVSLFMSLLVSIFDKFEGTDLKTKNLLEEEITRLKQKKNFFKKFISITSYLVVMSIFIILLCSLNFIFDLTMKVDYKITLTEFARSYQDFDLSRTLSTIIVVIYRVALNYFLLNYLLMTLFVTSSAYEYYISEINRRKVQ
ncbi:hypothetical protein CMT25_06825 [Elizabethkingia anophelis]|uniref:hypothetical protein n=1 Tax=Elizabethkingia anophelis TaxID=1117645 RepID=UPI0009996F83|nr:hypothetical protein [Elizabethkingia anophelis]MDV4129853.1 hypothetical protein [Elizabethkingia anophelis]MDV4135712.1 hypothetical protein [Elizabethkingia anophelis]OPC60822.1 hypothetical protein BAY08_12420 [Elizabethkingia anophelis]